MLRISDAIAMQKEGEKLLYVRTIYVNSYKIIFSSFRSIGLGVHRLRLV